MNDDDQLRSALRRGVEGLEPTDDDPIATVEGVVRRRRNRRRTAAGLGSAAAVALVVVGAVTLFDGRGGNNTEIATPTTTTDAGPVRNTVEVTLYSPGGVALGPDTDEFWTSFECYLVDGQCLTPSGAAGYQVDVPLEATPELGASSNYYSVAFDIDPAGFPEYEPLEGDVSVDINGVTTWYTPPDVQAARMEAAGDVVAGDIGVPNLTWVTPEGVRVSVSGSWMSDDADGLPTMDTLIEFARTLEPVTVRVPYTLVDPPEVVEPEEPVEPVTTELVLGPDGIAGVAAWGDPLDDVIAALDPFLGAPSDLDDEPDPEFEERGISWEFGSVNGMPGGLAIGGTRTVESRFDGNTYFPAATMLTVSVSLDTGAPPLPIRTASGITLGTSEADLFAAYDVIEADTSTGCGATTLGGSEGRYDIYDVPTRYLYTRDRFTFVITNGMVTGITAHGAPTGNQSQCVYNWFGLFQDQ